MKNLFVLFFISLSLPALANSNSDEAESKASIIAALEAETQTQCISLSPDHADITLSLLCTRAGQTEPTESYSITYLDEKRFSGFGDVSYGTRSGYCNVDGTLKNTYVTSIEITCTEAD